MPFKIGGGGLLQSYNEENGEYTKEHLKAFSKLYAISDSEELNYYKHYSYANNTIHFPNSYVHDDKYCLDFIITFSEEIKRINRLDKNSTLSFISNNEYGFFFSSTLNGNIHYYQLNSSLESRELLSNFDTLTDEQKLIDLNVVYPLSLKDNSPIYIPENSRMTIKFTNYYHVIFEWETEDGFKMISRWHTDTPNQPIAGDSWRVERKKPGRGYGNPPIEPIHEDLIGNGHFLKWISHNDFKKAVYARKQNKATSEQIRILDLAHHRRIKWRI